MGLAAGSLSQVSVGQTVDSLLSTAATGGTTPYAYQWYRSTTTSFSPGAGNLLSGATSLALNDTGLVPGVIYYYKVIAIDSAATPASVTTSQLVVTTTALANQALNQFAMAPVLGQLDQMFNGDTLEVRYDPAGSGNLVAGQAVYWSTVANGTPMVLPSTATSDVVAGFVNFSIKDQSFAPGANLEISMRGNVMYLLAALAINRGQEVTSLPAGVAGGVVGGVIPAVGSGGLPKVGFALDTVSQGNLVRIFLSSPGYIVS